jgi:transposase
MYARGKKSEREISRATGLSRNTVAKWLHEPVQGAPKYQRERISANLTI